jgi:hypothetical protein
MGNDQLDSIQYITLNGKGSCKESNEQIHARSKLGLGWGSAIGAFIIHTARTPRNVFGWGNMP